MMTCDVTKEISYKYVLDMAQLLYEADIVRAEAVAGGTWVLKGRDILERIVIAGESKRIAMLTVTVVNTIQADIIIGILGVRPISEEVARRRASMLNEAIGIGPEYLH